MPPIYGTRSLALLTDYYEITMAYGYWKQKMFDEEAVFNLFFRKKPFNGGFAVAAGLEAVIDYLQNYRFDRSDLDYLASLKDEKGAPLFEVGFLDYLAALRLTCDIDAIQEGDLVFPYEPLIRVQGPLIQCQLLESTLLTLTNFSTLIATKAARVCLAAKDDPVIEFGLRRAQGIDGAMTAARSAYIGGCAGTSNVYAGKVYGIPVRGTMAHSWVMAFDTELESFQAFAKAMPSNTVFLVDTYDTLQGVKNAIVVGKWLRDHEYPFLGIRLDSGDLAYLSIESRKLLDEAGFQEALIMASNELDETLIADLKQQGAQIAVWGVGTHLVTGAGQPALDGVYKITAIRKKGQEWIYKIKLSEHLTKVTDPGILQVRRYYSDGNCVADAIYDIHTDLSKGCEIFDPADRIRRKKLSSQLQYRDLLVPIFRKGKCIYKKPTLAEIRAFSKEESAKLDRSIKRFINPHIYPVGMESSLYDLKIALVNEIRNGIQKKREL